MTENELAAFVVATITIGAVIIAGILVWSRRRSITPGPDVKELNERLARIEQAVDAIAVEAERISEGQRFTTRLLSEKSPVRSEHR